MQTQLSLIKTNQPNLSHLIIIQTLMYPNIIPLNLIFPGPAQANLTEPDSHQP